MTAAGDALAAAGATRSQVRSAAFRLAGVDWPEDGEFWDIELARQWPGLSRSILNDGYAAIRCSELSGTGVAVNAGTAGAIAARGPDGTTWHMGWWGQARDGRVRADVRGAEGGIPVTSAVAARLADTPPPTSFFRT